MTKKEVYAKLRDDIQKNGGDILFTSLELSNDLVLTIQDKPKKKKKDED